MATRSIPAPGQAAMPAADAAVLVRTNGTDPLVARRPAVRFGDRVWTHAEFHAESARWAHWMLAQRPDGPFHVGVLLDNTPDYLFALGGAALAGATVVGLNHTRVGASLARDAEHTHVGLLVTERRHVDDVTPVIDALGLGPDRILVSQRYEDEQAGMAPSVGRDLDEVIASHPDDDPGLEPGPDTQWALIFTSGTSSAPKAVICTQRRLLVTGARMGIIMDIGPDDVGYVCMPLFHSNAVMVGWAPSLVCGASVGLARRFSASGWLHDVRRYGATYFNYTGKPLSYLVATPEGSDDADNPVRIAFGNEGSPDVVERFARRFDVEVIDAFGATEGGLAVNRDVDPRPGALGVAGDSVRVVDEVGTEKPRAAFDRSGRLTNAEACVGEIVNTAGSGPFEGYYNNDDATRRTTRNGWFWSGDLGYLDADGYLYFAGRNADWIRVDGENFPAGPIDAAIARHPDVVIAAAYGVPDVDSGDQVMAAIVLRDGVAFDPAGFAAWLDALTDIGSKWRPRYVRVARAIPTTGTNKVLKRELARQKFLEVGDDVVWVRDRGDPAYRTFGHDDVADLRASFVASGRARFLDL